MPNGLYHNFILGTYCSATGVGYSLFFYLWFDNRYTFGDYAFIGNGLQVIYPGRYFL